VIIYSADDELLALEFIEQNIKRVVPDAEVFTFQKPKELLEKAKEIWPDVVFLDVEMPGASGIEIAKELKKINENCNIVFVTGYTEYMLDAWSLYASGYIIKPVTTEAIKKALGNLRYSIETVKDIEIKTFGNFTVFYKEDAVNFRLAKSRELLAYLVDRDGALVSRRDVFAALFEDEEYDRNGQKKLSKAVRGLEQDLEQSNVKNLFIREKDGYRINKNIVSCDLYKYLDEDNKSLFHGEYMEQYSWGEDFKAIHFDQI